MGNCECCGEVLTNENTETVAYDVCTMCLWQACNHN